MTTSNRLGITEMASTQNGRAATVNEAIAKLEAGATCFAALSIGDNTPAVGPAEGDLYVLGAAPTGVWSGKAKNVAVYYNGAWFFLPPIEGALAYAQDANAYYFYDSSAWSLLAGGGGAGDVVGPASVTDGNPTVFDGTTGKLIKERTFTQFTASLIAMVGDSGSGGTKGLVPAPGTGDAAAVKFLKADGTWAVPAGTGTSFTAASTTEVLTGTDTAKGVTADALAALWEKGADVASSGTTSLGEGGYFHITGTTTITDIDWATAKDGRAAIVIFDGVLTLTHHATTLKLPGNGNITTAAGDRAIFVQDASDNVICVLYLRADGSPLNSTVVRSTATANFTAGYTSTAYNAGTQTTGTLTPDPANGNLQRAVNGGAHTLAPPSVGGGDALTMVIQYTNNGSAGALTTSGFTKKTGDALTTVNGDDFLFHITVINGFSHLNVVAMQ